MIDISEYLAVVLGNSLQLRLYFYLLWFVSWQLNSHNSFLVGEGCLLSLIRSFNFDSFFKLLVIPCPLIPRSPKLLLFPFRINPTTSFGGKTVTLLFQYLTYSFGWLVFAKILLLSTGDTAVEKDTISTLQSLYSS